MSAFKRAVALLLIICLTLPLLSSCGLGDIIPSFYVLDEDGTPEGETYHVIPDLIRVSIVDGDGYEITSANPVDVVKGGEVKFNITIDEGYELDYATGGAVYEKSQASVSCDAGVIVLSDVKYPVTVEIRVKEKHTPIEPPVGEICHHTGGEATCTERAVCDNCGERYGTALGHVFAEPMSYDGEKHWYVCKNEGCGEIVGSFEHFGGRATCEELARCELCGASYGDYSEHIWGEECQPSEDGHVYTCVVCEAESGVEAHFGGVADCTTLSKCTACGESYGSFSGHLWGDSLESSASGHWYECERPYCLARTDTVAHSGGDATCVSLARCDECGKEYGNYAAHVFGDTPVSSSAGHWYECELPSCNASTDIAPHHGGAATCQTLAECDICGSTFGSYSDHTWGSTLVSDGSSHWYGCEIEGCNEKTAVASHFGGSATCTSLAECVACGKTYGAYGSHKISEHLEFSEYVHYYPCENEGCDYKTGIASHYGGTATSYGSPICEGCGAEYGEAIGPHEHTGGTATCQEFATCILCGEEYGSLGAHKWSDSLSFDGHSHWYSCLIPGCTEKNGLSSHSGGTATCQALAKCDACGVSYGEYGAHDWADTLSSDAESHFFGCKTAGCTEKNGLSSHTGGTATCQTLAKCDACGVPYGEYGAHDWADGFKSNLLNHWHECKNDGCTEKSEPSAHYGGSATCRERAVCEACERAYGTYGEHDWADTLSYDDKKHWYDCKNAKCSAKNEAEAHYGGTATNVTLANCDACGVPYGDYAEFRTVYLEAPAPEEGYKFICWTVDLPAKEGGALITDRESGEFNIPYEGEPVANFVEVGYHVILYRTNGGLTYDGKSYYFQTFSNAHFDMPNTLHQNGRFSRSGYVLMRYTKEADGSGDYTTLGGKIMPNENGFVELWCKWGRATAASAFTYVSATNIYGETTIAITSYKGTDTDVVVPETIGGYSVSKITAGAFENASITSLVLPSTVDTVEDGAFKNCTSLGEITFHDTIWYVSDKSFEGCTNMKQYYFNAAMLPVHAGSGEGLFCLKYERLRMAKARGENVMLVVSGSSSLHGLSARQLQEAFNNEYTAVNYGTNAGAQTLIYLRGFERFLDEGDIVIQAPETTSWDTQLGNTNVYWRTLRGCECMYEVFSYQDMSIYTKFFDALAEFNQTQRTDTSTGTPKTGRSYESWANFTDEYTDLVSVGSGPTYAIPANRTTNPYNLSYIRENCIERFNELYSRLSSKGVRMYMSFAPTDGDYCVDAVWSEETQVAFRNKLQGFLDYPVISHPGDYLLSHSLMYNSQYHPTGEGRRVRTEQLIADLKAQMIKEGIWQE